VTLRACVYVYARVLVPPTRDPAVDATIPKVASHIDITRFSLYTILSLPIMYGAWYTNGRSEGGAYTAQLSYNSIRVRMNLTISCKG